MKFPGTINLKLPLFVFTILLLLVVTDIFYVDTVADITAVDWIFYLIIHIGFWLCTAFLFNAIINKFYWGGVKKVPVGNFLLNRVRDFVGALSYVIVIIVILVGYFDFDYNFNLIAVGFIVAILGMFIRQPILSSVKTMFLSSSSVFNIGDEIKLTAINSDTTITGKVDSFDKRNIRLVNQNGNFVSIPQQSLIDFVVENYWGNETESRFELNIILPFSVKTARAKRILLSAVKTTYFDHKINSQNDPEVIAAKFLTTGIEYSIHYWLDVRKYNDVDVLKDLIITNTLKYLEYSGIDLTQSIPSMESRKLDTESSQASIKLDVNKVLEHIEIFESLNQNEIAEIADSVKCREYNAHEVVINENESGDSMFIVIEGLLDVLVTSEDGKQLTVGRLTPGEFFGEMSLMTGEKRSATVKCETGVLLYEVTKDSISKIIANRKELIEEFGEIISRRTQSNIDLLEKYEKSKYSVLNEIVTKIKKFFKHN